MNNEKLLQNLEKFDKELWEALYVSLSKQISTLSLIPTTNAASPFASYLKGSTLGNEFLDHHAQKHRSTVERLAQKRARELFGADHAIVRTESPVAASRVVLLALLNQEDTVLSFNLRKKEHCTGNTMNYRFVNFSVEPGSFLIDFDKLKKTAEAEKPKLIVYSPVNYPKNIDCQKLRDIADSVGAKLWIDLGQNSGLVAAKVIPSPVPYADVVTFAASDALHGPQSGIILCKADLADLLDKTVINTGHLSQKKNVLAALAIILKEASCEEYVDYAEQVVANARALERGIFEAGCNLICHPTENHLVILRLQEGIDGNELVQKLADAGLLVKFEYLITAEESKRYPVLRLSSLDATTRSLREDEMFKVGKLLGEFISSKQDEAAQTQVKKSIKRLVEHLPLFSDEWLPELEAEDEENTDLVMKSMVYWRV